MLRGTLPRFRAIYVDEDSPGRPPAIIFDNRNFLLPQVKA